MRSLCWTRSLCPNGASPAATAPAFLLYQKWSVLFQAGKVRGNAVSCTQHFTRNTIPSQCLIHIQWVFLTDQQSRALLLMIPEPGPCPSSLGKCLEKTAVLSRRHSENSGAIFSPAPSIREVIKAARAKRCKEFFLKHRKSPVRYHQMGKQLWNIPAVLQQGAIPPQSIPWGFPQLAPAKHAPVVNAWSQAWNSLNSLSNKEKLSKSWRFIVRSSRLSSFWETGLIPHSKFAWVFWIFFFLVAWSHCTFALTISTLYLWELCSCVMNFIVHFRLGTLTQAPGEHFTLTGNILCWPLSSAAKSSQLEK